MLILKIITTTRKGVQDKMTELEFAHKARTLVRRYLTQLKKQFPQSTGDIDPKSTTVYIVWQSKTLQNNKAMLSTDISDGRYYEVTYNGDKDEFYFDSYKKEFNHAIKNGDEI